MSGNVPDDWGCYYYRCSLCRSRYHASEGGCSCSEDLTLCVGRNCGHEDRATSYHEETTEVNDREYCEECFCCFGCLTEENLSYSEELGDLLCPDCQEEENGEGL